MRIFVAPRAEVVFFLYLFPLLSNNRRENRTDPSVMFAIVSSFLAGIWNEVTYCVRCSTKASQIQSMLRD